MPYCLAKTLIPFSEQTISHSRGDMKGSQRTQGYLMIATMATSAASVSILAKYALQSGTNVAALLFIRFLSSTLLLAALAGHSRGKSLTTKEAATALLLGFLGLAGQSGAYFSSLLYSSVGLSALLMYTYPVMYVALSAIFMGERFSLGKLLIIILATLGGAMAIGEGGGGSLIGAVLALLAALIYSTFVVLSGRYLTAADPIRLATVLCFGAWIACASSAIWLPLRFPLNAASWVSVVLIGTLGTPLAIVCFYAGLRRIGGTATVVMSTLDPILTVAFGVLMLDESVSWMQVGGGVIVVAAVAILAGLTEGPAPPTGKPCPLSPSRP